MTQTNRQTHRLLYMSLWSPCLKCKVDYSLRIFQVLPGYQQAEIDPFRLWILHPQKWSKIIFWLFWPFLTVLGYFWLFWAILTVLSYNKWNFRQIYSKTGQSAKMWHSTDRYIPKLGRNKKRDAARTDIPQNRPSGEKERRVWVQKTEQNFRVFRFQIWISVFSTLSNL